MSKVVVGPKKYVRNFLRSDELREVREEEVDRIAEAIGIPYQNRPDMVNHPSHYTFSKYEVADVSDEWYPNEPLLWNANKYLARWDKKGDPIENLEKAIWYLNRKIAQLKKGQ